MAIITLIEVKQEIADIHMHHHVPNVAQTQWTISEDVKDWSMEDVEAWWRTLGPNAQRFFGMVRRRVLNGERLLKMKRADFDAEGMESWMAKSFVQWVRDLKYDSPDPVSTRELTDIVNRNTKFGPNISHLIARFVRDNPDDWDRKELAYYLKSRGLKKIAKRVKKERITSENVEILITDPKIASHERDELQFLFPHVCFYNRRFPHPHSWYAIIKDFLPAWAVFLVAIVSIACVLLARGAIEGAPAFVALGAIFLTVIISIIMCCAFHPRFWLSPASCKC